MDYSAIFTVITDPKLVALLFLGVLGGMYIGAIPGLSGTMAASLLISFTYSWDVLPALAVMVGVHVGAVYGGSRSAILLNIPGAPAAIATVMEGYPLAKKGQAAKAIGITVMQSVLGGLIGCLILLLATEHVAKFALQFAARDYVLLGMMGLVLIASLGGNSFLKSLLCGALGLFIGCIGLDAVDGVKRFTFGIPYLYGGINYVAIMIGVFGFAEALSQIRDIHLNIEMKQDVGKVRPDFKEVLHYFPLALRCSLLGTFVGALPGTGGDIAALMAYDHAKRSTKNPKVPFGEGAIEGLVAPESANNAAVGGAYIPVLAFGIPGDGYCAIVIGALGIHGLNPGPALMMNQPEVVGIIAGGLLLANIFLLPIGFSGIRVFAKIVEIPRGILMPIVMALCVIGSYALNGNIIDVCVMLFFGFLGYFMKRHDYPVGSMVLGVILCSLIERNMRRDWNLTHDSLWASFTGIFSSPISIVLFAVVVAMVIGQTPFWRNRKKRKEKAK